MAACTCSLCFEQATKKLQTVFNTSKICNCLDLFCTSMALKMCSGEICNNSVQFQIEIRKISHRRSSYYAELGHFTLFCRGQQRTVQSLIACKAIILLIKLFVLWHSHCRQCRGLLKPPIIQVGVSPPPPKQCLNSGSTLDESTSTLCSGWEEAGGQKDHIWAKVSQDFLPGL